MPSPESALGATITADQRGFFVEQRLPRLVG